MPGIANQVPISGVEDCKAAPVRKSADQQQDQVTKCMQMHGSAGWCSGMETHHGAGKNQRNTSHERHSAHGAGGSLGHAAQATRGTAHVPVRAAHEAGGGHGQADNVAGQALQHDLLAAVVPLVAQGADVHAACAPGFYGSEVTEWCGCAYELSRIAALLCSIVMPR